MRLSRSVIRADSDVGIIILGSVGSCASAGVCSNNANRAGAINLRIKSILIKIEIFYQDANKDSSYHEKVATVMSWGNA